MKLSTQLFLLVMLLISCRNRGSDFQQEYDCIKEHSDSFSAVALAYVEEMYISDTAFYREYSNFSDYQSQKLSSSQIDVSLHSLFANDSLFALRFDPCYPGSTGKYGGKYIARIDSAGEKEQELLPVFVSYLPMEDTVVVGHYYEFFTQNSYNFKGFRYKFDSLETEMPDSIMDSLILRKVRLPECQMFSRK